MKAIYKSVNENLYPSKSSRRKKLFLKHSFFINALILISTGLYAQRQINITPGSYLVLNGNVALVTNNAAINNNGTIVPGNATLYFTGNSDTTLSYVTGTSTTTCTNLTINKSSFGTAIKSPVNVTGVLTMNAGNLYPDSNLTLISTAANTARLAPVPPSCSIPGKAFMQRYIPARRAWRLMTAPFTNSNTIYDTWQNSGVYTVGVGTYVTSPVHTAANGMDISPQNNYSLYTFNPSTQQFAVVQNTKTAISPGTSGSGDNAGYFLFVRGDRNPANVIVPNCNITTLSTNGKLQTGNQTFTAAGAAAGQYTLIGNPYASPLDFSQISRTNLVNRFYAWDPTLNTLGAFVVLDDLDADGTYDKSISGSAQTTIIQSSQAFFVQAYTAGSTSLTIGESAKSIVSNNLVFRPAAPLPKLITNLYLQSPDTSILADGTFVQFDNRFSDSVNLDDAKKIGNTNENLGFLRHGVTLAMERRPDININDTLFLRLTTTTQRDYRFEFIASNIKHPELTAYLQDQYLNSSTPVDLAGNTIVYFTINATAASSNPTRFFIVFQPSSALPVTFTSVKTYKQSDDIAVEWHVDNEISISKYEVEKSTDGKNFSYAGIVAASGNNNSSVTYKWLDTDPANGNNFYRIKSINNDGSVKYSEVVKVTIGNTENFITVYPNPIQNNTINIQFNNQPVGNYQAKLLTDAGQLIYETNVSVTGNNVTEALSIKQSLSKGVYQLKLVGPAKNNSTQKILVQ